MLANCLAVTNAKGGVGKTSITANLAAAAAAGGWRTLAVDLDAQGNLARDLGYWEVSDEGFALSRALLAGAPPTPLSDVRPGLDVLAGGRELACLAQPGAADDLTGRLRQALAGLAGGYHLIVLDCPPAAGPVHRAALGVAGFALIPTKVDDASIDGLEGLAGELTTVRATSNPALCLLGVVLFDLGAGDHRLRAEARAALEALLDGVAPLLAATIRHSRRAAHDLRRTGQVAAEYERAALTSPGWIHDRTAPAFTTAASGLAADYQQLTDEVLGAIVAHRRNAEATS